MGANYLAKGSFNVICDQCGRKYKADQTRMQWDNLRTCYHCYDPKHPWLIPLPAVIDGLPVPNARPRPSDNSQYSKWVSFTIIGVNYQNSKDQSMGPNPIITSWDEIIGGTEGLQFNSTNFPLV